MADGQTDRRQATVAVLRRLKTQVTAVEAAAYTPDPTATPDAIAFALHAVYDAWEVFKSDRSNKDTDEYVAGYTDGRTAAALVWARSYGTHDFVQFGDRPDIIGRSFGQMVQAWRWQPWVVSTDTRIRQQWYDEHVAGFDVLGPLVVAQRWLIRELP